jgi:hypothetical protein
MGTTLKNQAVLIPALIRFWGFGIRDAAARVSARRDGFRKNAATVFARKRREKP